MDSKLKIKTLFASLDLDKEFADIYFALLRFGPLTISDLSKKSSIERTKLYRLLPQAQKYKILEIDQLPKRQLIKAAPIDNIRILIERRRAAQNFATQTLGQLESDLQASSIFSPTTKVRMYSGKEGIKQMLWNETRATNEVCSYLYDSISTYTGRLFASRWAEKCNSNGLVFRSIVNPSFISKRTELYFSDIDVKLNNWTPRVISPDRFPITHATVIYDDIVGYFNWLGDEVYGIEIQNKEIAKSTLLGFESLWDQCDRV